ncbi:2-oxo acid dehydrogenase subunit E2 [Aurantiacibacter rhizosphaerae]|uniref:Dihydrolipoyllysine-residue acetyltransferase component of pyruvate dehydrogenase complex n=1 Tax=Aurantiacibacter rhizosphaerae TaxID=2691582 RepID=A0A844XDT6_9SPHN|nr:2-oxo acid dehydrogenase subunit E2 [Aurantiacibacter rhizosphaerae]MWV27774.1 dihydrolipoamide acetyltransferase [Aurantiacibacter rhizosphaerae]
MTKITELLDRLAPFPAMDFSEWGEVEITPTTRYQKLTGQFLGRNWVGIPHVTHNDEVDVTEAEANRRAWNADNPEEKITPVAMAAKALVEVLRQFPMFNASLSEDGDALILKRYFNIGIAVDTPNGLLVPVIHGCNTQTTAEIAASMAILAEKARDKGLSMAEMSGSSITVSSLGHIGGTSFTPIINSPDVAIVGLTKLIERPVRGADDAPEWRLFLPVSLSYDHRVINGADAARFVVALGKALNDKALFA